MIRRHFVMVILLVLLNMGGSFGTINFSPQYAIAEPPCDDGSDEVNASSNNDFVPYETFNSAAGGKIIMQRPSNWKMDEKSEYSIMTGIIRIVEFFAPLEKKGDIENSLGYNTGLSIYQNPFVTDKNMMNVTNLQDYLNRAINDYIGYDRQDVDINITKMNSTLDNFLLGTPAYRLEIEAGYIKDPTNIIRILQIGTLRENNGYVVIFRTEGKNDDIDKNLCIAEKMINSLQLSRSPTTNLAYSNKNLGFEIVYPSNWTKVEIMSDTTPLAFFSPQEDIFDGYWEDLELQIFPAGVMPLHEIVRQRINVIRSQANIHNFEVLTIQETSLAGIHAINSIVQYNTESTSPLSKEVIPIRLRVDDFITLKDNIAYDWTYYSNIEDYTEHAPVVKEIVKSFAIDNSSAGKDEVYQQNLLKGIKVEGYPTYLSFNSATNRLYVANYLSNTISVIDGESNHVVDIIDVGKSPIGIDTSSEPYINRIYVLNQKSNDLDIVDGINNKVIQTLSVLEEPLEVRVNPNSQTIYIANANNLTIVDGFTNSVYSNITLPYDPSWNATYIALDPYKDIVYISQSCHYCPSHNSTISALDASTSNLTKHGEGIIVRGEITAMDINQVNGLLYAANIFDPANDSSLLNDISSIAVIDGSTRNKTISMTDPRENRIMLKVGEYPISLDVNPTTDTIYVAIKKIFEGTSGIYVINGSNNMIEDFIQINGSITSMTFDSYRNAVYAADGQYNMIYKINGTTNQLIYDVNFDIWPPDSGTMNCDIVDYINNSGQASRFEVSDNTRLEFDHGRTLLCTAKPKSDYFPVISQIGELIGIRDISDDYRFEGFSLIGIEDFDESTKVAVKEQEPISINGYLNLTANFKQVDPSFASSQVQTIHGVFISAVLTSALGGGVKLYQKRKRDALIKYSRAIDSIYRVFHERDSDECIRNLNQIRTKLLELLNESKINEDDYAQLNAKISQYEDEIRSKEKIHDSNNN